LAPCVQQVINAMKKRRTGRQADAPPRCHRRVAVAVDQLRLTDSL
jgi:hypothetical protein